MQPNQLLTWRILKSGAQNGYINMAEDEAISLSIAEGKAPPTIRFYGWEPFALSLGYFQKVDSKLDLDYCQKNKIDIVRRPTGGRAILHAEEITFSVSLPIAFVPGKNDILGSYQWISEGILQGLHQLGIPAIMARGHLKKGSEGSAAACFKSAARCDITVQDRKIVGSAQSRRNGVILQQTSIPIFTNLQLMSNVFHEATSWDGMTGLSQWIKSPVTIDQVVNALISGFEKTLQMHLDPGELSEWEENVTKKLLHEKYQSDAWNLCGNRS